MAGPGKGIDAESSCYGGTIRAAGTSRGDGRGFAARVQLYYFREGEQFERQEQQSYVSFLLKRAHEGLLATISENAFGTKHFRDLPIEKLRWLAKQVKDRRQPRRGQSGRQFYRQQLRALETAGAGVREPDPF